MSCDLCLSWVTYPSGVCSIRVFCVLYHLYRIPSYTWCYEIICCWCWSKGGRKMYRHWGVYNNATHWYFMITVNIIRTWLWRSALPGVPSCVLLQYNNHHHQHYGLDQLNWQMFLLCSNYILIRWSNWLLVILEEVTELSTWSKTFMLSSLQVCLKMKHCRMWSLIWREPQV